MELELGGQAADERCGKKGEKIRSSQLRPNKMKMQETQKSCTREQNEQNQAHETVAIVLCMQHTANEFGMLTHHFWCKMHFKPSRGFFNFYCEGISILIGESKRPDSVGEAHGVFLLCTRHSSNGIEWNKAKASKLNEIEEN